MFNERDENYLLRVLARNDVVLFLGAGFASAARNQRGEPFPLASELASLLWDFLRYEGPYDGTSLSDMYEAVMREGVPFHDISMFLRETLTAREVPSEYDLITKVFWYRIFTTNVDDILPTIYRRSGNQPRLQILPYPNAEPLERDPTLETIQAIYLHGALPCRPDEITFSTRQLAGRAGESSPLYEQFIRDYATHPTIFIGTELNEPLFWQHIEARERRLGGISEQRPKSFLVAPRISPPKRAQLESYNVMPVEGSAMDLLNWLEERRSDLPPKRDVLRVALPSLVAIFERLGEDREIGQALREFGTSFHLVPSEMSTGGDRSFYLLGATPRWEDIHRNLDAPRVVTDEVQSHVEGVLEGSDGARVLALLGSAGCGKSTVLRRLGVRLDQAGRTVFLTNSESLPTAHVIRHAVMAFDAPCVLLFDNAEIALDSIGDIVEATHDIERRPVLVVASRLSDYDRRATRLEAKTDVIEVKVPDLVREEIIHVIKVLETNNLLGRLRGMTQTERIREFELRASKQLLVAMREATHGAGFDEIIKNEFDGLPSFETKELYLCVALATDAGYRISRQQFIACAAVPAAEALHLLERNLSGIVIPTGPKNELLLLRHSLIAEFVLNEVAPRSMASQAYVRILGVLAPEIKGAGRRSRTFGLYRELLNHKVIYYRFTATIDEARTIYDSITRHVSSDADYWLQYGLLELEFGNLDLSENYLRQAESLFPDSNYIRNSIGYLLIKKGLQADAIESAIQYRARGTEILEAQMLIDDGPYPYHIYAAQRLAWARRWLVAKRERKEELEHLREVIREGRRHFPRNKQLKRLEVDLNGEYLYLAVE